MMAWRMPEASFTGVEAQDVSFALLEKNVERNRLGDRVRVHHGDLRDAAVIAALGDGYELVTGTPPYFPPGAALDAEDQQRAYARIEYRGGVEAYLVTGARIMSQDGTMVLCGEGGVEPRVREGGAAVGLFIRARCEIFAHAAATKPLFTAWTMSRSDGAVTPTSLLLRGEDGEPTEDARALRAFSGFDP